MGLKNGDHDPPKALQSSPKSRAMAPGPFESLEATSRVIAGAEVKPV